MRDFLQHWACTAQIIHMLFNICLHKLDFHRSRSTNYSTTPNLQIHQSLCEGIWSIFTGTDGCLEWNQ
jgi:hypothetical protein